MAGSTPPSTMFLKTLMPGFQHTLGSWPVAVGSSGNRELSFEGDGWKEFVNHHGLKVGEFLLFERKGNMSFDVIVYEERGCAKEFPSPSLSIQISKAHGIPGKSYVTIPAKFAKSNALGDRSSMILRIPSAGRSWPVGIQTCRVAINSKEWSVFYVDNNLKEGDICEFELKSRWEPVVLDVKISST